MSDKITALVFRLEGPLQSWGDKANWDYRDTCDFPTKSGIVGIIACAAGFERGNPNIFRLSSQLKVSVRADSSGRVMTDYHTVTGEFICANLGKKKNNSLNAGKPDLKKNKVKINKETGYDDDDNEENYNTKQTYRQYLQDASFLVAIEGFSEVLVECKGYLDNPVWAPYLGRLSCAPSTPILPKLITDYGSIDELMKKYPISSRFNTKMMMYERDCDDSILGYVKNDEITVKSRHFKQRIVSRHFIEVEVCKNVFIET